MNLAPALTAPIEIQLHLASVVPAAFIGLWLIMFSIKGKTAHRILGYAYLVLMTVTAISAIFITSAGDFPRLFGFSPIHLFIPLTLFGVVGGLLAARKHDAARHKRAMLGMFIGAIVIAGALTFTPGRVMYNIFLAGG